MHINFKLIAAFLFWLITLSCTLLADHNICMDCLFVCLSFTLVLLLNIIISEYNCNKRHNYVLMDSVNIYIMMFSAAYWPLLSVCVKCNVMH